MLKPGAKYYVNIDPGVFLAGPGGAPIGAVKDTETWRFQVRAAAPVAGASRVTVTADGSGDFCTVQGAVDYIPASNTAPVTISLAAGTYREIVAIQTKHSVTLRGEDRSASIISYPNNGALQIPPGQTASMGTKFRAMIGVDGSNDLLIENITLWNPSPQLPTDGQSETLRIEGGFPERRAQRDHQGTQDTLLMSGQVYIANSIIEGNVDFVWGNGAVYFDHCEIKVVARKGYNVQARNAVGAMGYVFVDCNLTADPGIVGHVLARTNKNVGLVGSMVAYLDCTMGPHIDPVGWLIDGSTRPAPDAGIADGGAAVDISNLRFWEYHSVDPAGARIDVSLRIPESRQLTDAEAAQLRDPVNVLSGWNPKATPADAGVPSPTESAATPRPAERGDGRWRASARGHLPLARFRQRLHQPRQRQLRLHARRLQQEVRLVEALQRAFERGPRHPLRGDQDVVEEVGVDADRGRDVLPGGARGRELLGAPDLPHLTDEHELDLQRRFRLRSMLAVSESERGTSPTPIALVSSEDRVLARLGDQVLDVVDADRA